MSNRKDGIFKISVKNLLLDQLNPRLYGDAANDSQTEIMEKIYDKEQIEELASSLSVNGYFEEEPIIIIPKNKEDFDSINLENYDNYEYLVIEGNRRTTSVKLLLTKNTIVDSDFPSIKDSEIKKGLSKIPAIIYENREDVDTYLSIRHISGNRKWDAYAKAKYIYEKVQQINKTEKSILKSIEKLSTLIGDIKSNVIKKNYIYFLVFKVIDEDIIEYSAKNIKERFSLLEVSLAAGNTTISKFIGLKPFKTVDFESPIIDDKHHENLENFTKWVYGKDENGFGTLIADSRQINAYLKPILGNSEATDHLKDYDDLEGAYELTNGEESLVIGNLKRSSKLLSNILSKVPKYKGNIDFIASYEDLKSNLDSVKKLMK